MPKRSGKLDFVNDPVPQGKRTYVLPDGTEVSNDTLVRQAWETGVGLAELKLHAGQYELFQQQQALGPHGRLFELCSRRYGKTWEEIVLFEHVGRTTRKAVMRFAAPTKQQAREIVIPNWQIITEDCPPELRAIDRTQQEGCYIWPTTGSRLYLAGTDDTDQIDRLRGPFAHLIIVDELGFHHCDLRRLVRSVLAPQLATTRGRMILSTTPPESMEHDATEFIKIAERNGQLVTKTVFNNPMLTHADLVSICAEANELSEVQDLAQIESILSGVTKGLPGWHREYLCELVTDDNLRVCREFDHRVHVHQSRPTPTYYTPYTSLDIAFSKDNCAALFGYLDFRNAQLVIEDEWLGKAKVMSEVRDAMFSRELSLWGEKPVLRFGDGSALGAAILATLTVDFNCEIQPCQMASDKEVMINSLREYMGAGRISINARCKNLISQLKDGIWDSGGKKADYQRSKTMGHLDALDSLIYMVRSVDWHLNPTPNGRMNEYNNYVLPKSGRYSTEQERAILTMVKGIFRA
jgi:hypothetical protein